MNAFFFKSRWGRNNYLVKAHGREEAISRLIARLSRHDSKMDPEKVHSLFEILDVESIIE